MSTADVCAIHRYHSPRPTAPDDHHVVPLSWGGPNVASNLIDLCPTSHRNVHCLLDAYVRAHGEPTWTMRRSFGPGERDLAMRAWDAAQADPALHPVLTS